MSSTEESSTLASSTSQDDGAWVDFVAGWCSGAAAVIACQPIDTVLTRLQAGTRFVPSSTGMDLAGATAASSGASGSSSTTSGIGIARNMFDQIGVRSFWRGSSAMITAVPMQNALLMGGYGVGKQWAENSKHDNVYSSIFVGGCMGGLMQSFLMSPVELVKVNQQVVGKSAITAIKDVLMGLTPKGGGGPPSAYGWRGLNATLLRDGIPHGVWFVAYDHCKNVCTAKISTESNNRDYHEQFTIPLFSGAYAATVAWGVGYPFDLIKTRIQVNTGTSSNCTTILGTAKELIKEANGRIFIGLYRGFLLKLVRSVPASMIGFTSYEYVAKQIRNK